MDEFNVDICLTGHDHTFSRSYQILDGNVVDYDISSGSVTNPDGTLYITTGSGSGSKYYNLLNYTPYYIAERTNACLPSFSTIDFRAAHLPSRHMTTMVINMRMILQSIRLIQICQWMRLLIMQKL